MIERFLYRRLTVNFQVKPFNCGDSDLNDAIKYLQQLLTVTYVFESENETVAFFSVLNDKIINKDSADSNGFCVYALQPPIELAMSIF